MSAIANFDAVMYVPPMTNEATRDIRKHYMEEYGLNLLVIPARCRLEALPMPQCKVGGIDARPLTAAMSE